MKLFGLYLGLVISFSLVRYLSDQIDEKKTEEEIPMFI